MRNPERNTPKNGKLIISPADGRIIKIQKYDIEDTEAWIDKGNFGRIKTSLNEISKKGYIISIFMSPFDVHYNRSPIEGVIKKITYKSGKFIATNCFHRAWIENEKNEFIIENKKLKIKVIQIAGLLARRIECLTKKGQKVKAGERIGLINLGSQCTLIVPDKIKIKVSQGQKVKAGETILGEI